MFLYYLSLGSNLGEREQTLRRAVERIEQQIGHVLRCSDFFYSKPWGFESEHDFCNICCAMETEMEPLDVLFHTQAIERQLGRKEKSSIINHNSELPHYSDRPIDIDLIRVFDANASEIKCQILNPKSSIINHNSSNAPLLTLPHPLWQQRDFVRIPLEQIMQ